MINQLRLVLNVKVRFIGLFLGELGLFLRDQVFIQQITRIKIIVIHAAVRADPAIIQKDVVRSKVVIKKICGGILCQEEMEQVPAAKAQVQEEVWAAEGAGDEDKWEETKRERVRVEIVYVHNAEQEPAIPGVHPVLI